MNLQAYTVNQDSKIIEALKKLNVNEGKVIFVIDDDKLVGSISDGDIRRKLMDPRPGGESIDYMNTKPSFIIDDEDSYFIRKKLINEGVVIVPIVDGKMSVIKIINLKKDKLFPVEVVIMAGGEGKRLLPLTANTPKPLIEINGKPIIDYNYETLRDLGVTSFHISINYLKEQIKQHFNLKEDVKSVKFIEEDKPLGTLGSLSLIDKIDSEYILIINSDILTNVNFTNFLDKFIESDCDLGLVSITYSIQIPYANLKIENNKLVDFEEKPTFDYSVNTGIYLMKKGVLADLPRNQFYNATDLLRDYLLEGKKIYIHSDHCYWKDIGKIKDLNQAKSDVFNLK